MRRMLVLAAGAVMLLACSKQSEDSGKKPAPGAPAKAPVLMGTTYGVKVEGRYDLAASAARIRARPGPAGRRHPWSPWRTTIASSPVGFRSGSAQLPGLRRCW